MSAAASQTILRMPQPAVPSAILDGLATHMRPHGSCLLMLHPDGSVAYHDAGAGLFFQRYVIPLLRHPELAGADLARRVGQLTASSPPQAWDLIPGATLYAAPFVQRRQVAAILVLAGRAVNFTLEEDVLRLCGRIGLDAVWLGQQAADLPAGSPARLEAGLHLLLAMAQDKLKLAAYESELNSVSTQLSNTYEELTLIDQISSGMKVNRSASDFFRQACLDVMQVINVRGMGIALCSERCRQEPVLYGELALPPGRVQRLGEQLTEALQGRKSALLVNDLSRDKSLRWLSEFATQLIAIPLQRQDQLLGCFFGLDKVHGEFDSVDAKLLTSIANESAIYLENAVLFADVHDLMMGLLHSLTSAVDAKDAYTCGHSERVALIARRLGRLARLSEAEVEKTYMAGLLHDVGKIGVPESVLQKTGRLTPEEFEQMKKHPQVGARILADVKQMDQIVPGVLHHHERFDGRGYPAGLAAEGIPLIGRIICLADSLDAMTSNRTYRKALPLEVALCEIRRCSGTQFDPALSELLVQISPDQFRSLLREHEQHAKRLLDLQQALRAAG